MYVTINILIQSTKNINVQKFLSSSYWSLIGSYIRWNTMFERRNPKIGKVAAEPMLEITPVITKYFGV